ncbi:transglutaminase-like domain-containing protein [Sphingomonas quercus]|uniref:Transglutaminase family protein n=1 Tax=Sphingomonas quercus TaxID=2842451 RepID=A0ABS6BJY0_9SPHN|nr:transglutaminase family protein [Sphingomonas quercus]MBU3077751.1 transglutaminase family protein [Sphingomonas quercus]
MRLNIRAELDYYFAEAADVLLALEVAPMADQRIVEDLLVVDGANGPLLPVPGEESIGRRTWLEAEGRFLATYTATVEVERATDPIAGLPAASRRALPALVVPYLWPSRYCEADRFAAFVAREFPGLEGGDLVLAMAAWIGEHVDYRPGTSDGTTTAADTFISRQGVCRDFAHLLTAFARAGGLPARAVSAYGLGVDPPDFHAVVEVWLADGWRLVDATGQSQADGLGRICVGRDATDISFMTIFGQAQLNQQTVTVTRG